MKDIAPELLEKIKKSFEEGMEQNGTMKKLEARLKSGEGGFEEAEQYAGEVGRALSAAFGEHLSSDVLPDGRMYFNIADRVVTPLMEEEYRLATEAGMEAVRAANERAGIHLQGREPAFEPERVKGIVDRLASEESFDAVKWILGDPVENYAVHCVDETVKKNAEFLHKAGRTARIRRDSASRCCDWCAALDGVYEYPGVPREIYARHNNCTCTVEYLPGDGKAQDVWSKNSRDVSNREERRIFSERAISKEEAEERIRRAEEIKKSLQERQKRGIFDPTEAIISQDELVDRFEIGRVEPLNQGIIAWRILDGQYGTQLKHQKYLQHVQGSPQYRNATVTRGRPQSYLTITERETQKIITDYAGTGRIQFNKNGEILDKEFVTVDRIIGRIYEKGGWVDTNRVQIIYGKDGAHVVPVKPK